MSNLRKKLTRLAYQKPELRSEILPLLRTAGSHKIPSKTAAKSYEQMILQIRRLTDRNDHSASVKILADFVNDKRAVSVVEAIQVITRYLGHLPDDLYQLRYKLLKSLLKKASSKMTPEEYQALDQSF